MQETKNEEENESLETLSNAIASKNQALFDSEIFNKISNKMEGLLDDSLQIIEDAFAKEGMSQKDRIALAKYALKTVTDLKTLENKNELEILKMKFEAENSKIAAKIQAEGLGSAVDAATANAIKGAFSGMASMMGYVVPDERVLNLDELPAQKLSAPEEEEEEEVICSPGSWAEVEEEVDDKEEDEESIPDFEIPEHLRS